MNSKQKKTFAAIYSRPTPTNLKWSEVESLLKALGGDVSEGAGSRVRVALNGVRAIFHRPHPRPEMKPYAVRAVADFLSAAGFEPRRD